MICRRQISSLEESGISPVPIQTAGREKRGSAQFQDTVRILSLVLPASIAVIDRKQDRPGLTNEKLYDISGDKHTTATLTGTGSP